MQVFVRLRLARRAVLLVGALFAVGLLAAGSAGAATYTWNVPLSGKDVIASHLPADPNATGSATITADNSANRICGTFSWSGIASPVVFGRDVTYVRDPNYWGRNLPARRGMANFDRITVKIYRDQTADWMATQLGR